MKHPARPAGDGFSADWLGQREPWDARARDQAAPRLELATRLDALRPGAGTPWRVIDLGCGTGANLRWLAPRLGGAQQWLAVDHDAALLRRWPALLGAVAVPDAARPGPRTPPLRFAGDGFQADIVRRRLDLATRLETLPWASAHLVTASALLDLVSAGWLQRLVAVAAAAPVAWLLALSVDGRHRWAPRDVHDEAVTALFGAHQQRDKGFGPALGAGAVPALARALRASGHRVHIARSDWVLDGRDGPRARALIARLVDGYCTAACEQDPAAAAMAHDWRRRRHALAPLGTLRIGHVDVLALPARRGRPSRS